MRLIDAEPLMKNGWSLRRTGASNVLLSTMSLADVPIIDAVPVVRCKNCVVHGNCFTEDTFRFVGIENPFCCAGKRKDGDG